MFRFFRKKSEAEKLQKRYNQLMREWHRLSRIDRAASDRKFAEAETVAAKLEALKKK